MSPNLNIQEISKLLYKLVSTRGNQETTVRTVTVYSAVYSTCVHIAAPETAHIKMNTDSLFNPIIDFI